MATQPQPTHIIEGTGYIISQVGGLTGARLLFRGGQAMAAGLTEAFTAKNLAGGLEMAVLMALGRRLPIDDFDWLCDEMAKCTQVGVKDTQGDGRVTFAPLADRFDDHFRGQQMALFTWLAKALEVNFASFTVAAKTRVEAWAAAKEAEKVASTSSPLPVPTDSGSSGVSSSAPG